MHINSQRLVSIATVVIVIYLLGFGVAMALFPIRPFWNDEWRLIYNIKFKDYEGLWGRLDLLQECPRVYLSLLKWICTAFDYSYTSLRLPPLIIGTMSVFLIFWLRKKLYEAGNALSYLFILIFISAQTFTDYLTQVKQYEMDLFLCLVALWQLLALLKIRDDHTHSIFHYVLLCLSFLLLPYLSYTYPITIAPIYPVILLILFKEYKNSSKKIISKALTLCSPLLLAAISILIFYLIDVKNLMADKSMYESYLKVFYEGGTPNFLHSFWNLFALVGSGFLFEIVFGVSGIAAFFYGIYRLAKTKLSAYSTFDYFRLYAVLLLILVLGLLATGKIVGGVARLTAYTVPAISILIISLLEDCKQKFGWTKLSDGMATVLFLALFGNIISTCINTFTYPEYQRRITTYRNTARALKEARQKHIPLLYTYGVYGNPYDVVPDTPGKISTNTITPEQIAGEPEVVGEVILKVNPEYKLWDTIPLYYMPDKKWIDEYVHQMPDSFRQVMAGDGINYKIYNR